MKKFFVSFVIIFSLCSIISCDNGELHVSNDDNENTNQGIDDPEGTITLSMRNGKGTYLDAIYIDSDDNFTGAMFASLGKVNGLGSVTHIPVTGWASKVAVTPGYGYVAYSEGIYYRIYVTDYTLNALNEIIGANVKYQKPFNGADEDIEAEESRIVFPGDTEDKRTLVFSNATIIPFTIEEIPQWCNVQKTTTFDEDFLYNAIAMESKPLKSAESVSGTIKLVTFHGHEKLITLVQEAAGPYIDCGQSVRIGAEKGGESLQVNSNLSFDEISVISDRDWLYATLSQEADSFLLEISCDDNYEEERMGTITISADGAESVSVEVIQEAPVLEALLSKISLPVSSGSYVAYFNCSSIPLEAISVSSDADWITFSEVRPSDYYSGTNAEVTLNYEMNMSEQDRETFVYVSSGNLTVEIKVEQDGAPMSVSNETLFFDRNVGAQSVTIYCDLEDYEAVSSDSDWCTVSKNDGGITIRVTSTTSDRETQITFPGFSPKIKVIQSKYAVGDTYDENGVNGIVKYMDGEVRIVLKETSLGKAQWSVENIAIGATDQYDGRKNMNVVKSISGWQSLYPAFAVVDALNTGGVTGWYLPALKELSYVGIDEDYSETVWSSSEVSSLQSGKAYVNTVNPYWGQAKSKQDSYSVYAVYRF